MPFAFLQFDTVEDLVAAAKLPGRPGAGRASRNPEKGSFNACSSFEEACRFAIEGWPEGRDKMHLAVEAAANSASFLPLPDVRYDVGGAYPLPALAAAGSPESMVNPVPQDEAKRPVIRILADQRVMWQYKPHQLFNWGAALAVTIDALELNGYRVEYEAAIFTQDGSDVYVARTVVKQAQDPLDLDRVAFATANADFFRRLHFSLIEQHMPVSWSRGSYGYALNSDRRRYAEEDQIVLPGPQIFPVNGRELSTPEAALAAFIPHFSKLLIDRFEDVPPNLYVNTGARG